MSDSVYSVSEIVGSSTDGIDDAIRGAIGRASKTLHNLDWFQVSDIRGRIEDNERCHFQVTLKVGFRLDEHSGLPGARAPGGAGRRTSGFRAVAAGRSGSAH